MPAGQVPWQEGLGGRLQIGMFVPHPQVLELPQPQEPELPQPLMPFEHEQLPLLSQTQPAPLFLLTVPQELFLYKEEPQ